MAPSQKGLNPLRHRALNTFLLGISCAKATAHHRRTLGFWQITRSTYLQDRAENEII